VPHQKNYKKFVAQFTAAEWKRLSQHRVFLHFLKVDLKKAASVAADALQRPVTYLFPVVRKAVTSTPSKTPSRLPSLPRHRRFRL
jgi:hypothetical protein